MTNQKSRAQQLTLLVQLTASAHQQATIHAKENKKALEDIQDSVGLIYEKQEMSCEIQNQIRRRIWEQHNEIIHEIRRLMVLVASGILTIVFTLVLLA